MKNLSDIVRKSKTYLECNTECKENELRADLDAFDGDFSAVIKKLKGEKFQKVESGWSMERRFQSPEFVEKYDGLYLPVYTPPDYDPETPVGLLIFLHGGGISNKNKSINCSSTNVATSHIADILEESGRIVCTPSAPYDTKAFARWNLPQIDEYLADIIQELEHFYNIDPHNIILGGHSMGGQGANHIAHRFADRLASVLSSGSSWDIAYWPCLKGCTMWMLQGINDAVMFKRRHGTVIDFTRLAKRRLEEAGIEHFYCEHSGGHNLSDAGCRMFIRDWLKWSNDKRRDPFYPHVVATTPRGLTPWIDYHRHKTPLASSQNYIDFHEISEAPHARWVTIDELDDETIIFDMVTMSECQDYNEADWNNFELKLKRKHIPGGIVEAFIRDDKVIEVSVQNVRKFSLWLHPAMLDLNNVKILLEGVEKFSGKLRPSLSTMLDSYKRRRDWGLLYPVKVTIDAGDMCQTVNQIEISRKKIRR